MRPGRPHRGCSVHSCAPQAVQRDRSLRWPGCQGRALQGRSGSRSPCRTGPLTITHHVDRHLRLAVAAIARHRGRSHVGLPRPGLLRADGLPASRWSERCRRSAGRTGCDQEAPTLHDAEGAFTADTFTGCSRRGPDGLSLLHERSWALQRVGMDPMLGNVFVRVVVRFAQGHVQRVPDCLDRRLNSGGRDL